MKPLYEYLNESFKWEDQDITTLHDLLGSLVDPDTTTWVEKYCPNMKNFPLFMDDHEKSLLTPLYDKFSKTGKIKLTNDEKKLVRRIAVFACKQAYTLNADIFHLYINVLHL